jgi:hypothetical protein
MSRPMKTTSRRPEKSPQERSAKPSSEIDVDEVLRLAREADEAAKQEPEPPRAKRKKAEPGNGQAVTVVETIEPDPEFIAMCQWGVGSLTELANVKLDWSDPGIHWKTKVSTLVARVIERIQPMQPSLTTDLLMIGGYTALWAIPNVSATIAAKRATKDKNALGNNGERKNLQDEGTNRPS